MALELKIGDMVIIDPDIKPLPGEIVLVKMKKEGATLLRRYRPLSKKDAKGFIAFELIPANDYWPKIIVDSEEVGAVIGTLVEHRCRRRLNAQGPAESNGTPSKQTTTTRS